jgi:hypothetical protein
MTEISRSADTEGKDHMKDFFISYNNADKDWAEWIAWILERAGFSVIFQLWDFEPGQNFILKMHEAITTTRKTIAVLSENYLNAEFTHSEWAAAFQRDPKSEKGVLVPIRVKECKPEGLLASIIYVDIVGFSEKDACKVILGAFSGRDERKPSDPPLYPGQASSQPAREATFPGIPTKANLPDTAPAPSRRESQSYSINQRMALMQKLEQSSPQRFNILVYLLKVPAGLVPSMPVKQSDRVIALLAWAEGPQGCGLSYIEQIWTEVKPPVSLSISQRGWRYVIATVVVLLVAAGIIYWLIPRSPQPPTISGPFNEFFDEFNTGRWIIPSSAKWSIKDGRLNIEKSEELMMPKDLNYKDFVMAFHLTLINDGGAAWAIRVKDSKDYYLFYLSGPGGNLKQGFYFYNVSGGSFNPNDYKYLSPEPTELEANGQYHILVKVKENSIDSSIIPSKGPDVGVEIPLGQYQGSRLPYGGIGFRTLGSEQFSIDDLFVRPSDTSQAPGE